MADSDGCFHISISNTCKIRNLRVICSFSIGQRMIDKPLKLSCIPFMTEIANYFQCKVNIKRENKIDVVAQANCKHYLVKSYFDKFPLMSSKYLEYMCYLNGLNYLGRKLTEQEILKVRALKDSMNLRRIYFN